jgi:DNA repair protein RecN (Recombination protein N)
MPAMLRELRVRNFAVVETVTVPFRPGLNVLTGETGAGKSILVDALLLVRGARAQTDVIRTDAETASVEAVFDVAPGSAAAAALEAVGLAVEDRQVVVRRELHRTGRHRAFVNDSPVTVGLLERLGDGLVEIHGQHEHQRLLAGARQLELLDGFAGAEKTARQVEGLHGTYRALLEEVEGLRSSERDRARREDLLRFQVAELAAAGLRPGEEEELRAERRRLQHAERFRQGLAEVAGLLRGDADSATARVGRAARVLRDLGRLDPAFETPAAGLDTAVAHLEEVLDSVRRLAGGIEAEPGRLEWVDERLDALTRLERKYGESEEAMLAFLDAARRDLERCQRHDEVLADLDRRLGAVRGELMSAAAALSEERRQAAERLGTLVQREIRLLGMERARFEVRVARRGEEDIGARGLDQVEFHLSANPGEEARPLARIASGGELSRTMLAIHAVLAAVDMVPTMVFDEVDAGVGGRVAGVVGDKLAAAARTRQILCVTHLPQVAARGDHHLRVAKGVRGGRTRATVGTLAGAERTDEIARMLGADPPTETARRHARELLAGRGR